MTLTLRDLPTRPATGPDQPPQYIGLRPPRIPTDLCCAHCGEVRALIPVRVVEREALGGVEHTDKRNEEWCRECFEGEDNAEVYER